MGQPQNQRAAWLQVLNYRQVAQLLVDWPELPCVLSLCSVAARIGMPLEDPGASNASTDFESLPAQTEQPATEGQPEPASPENQLSTVNHEPAS